MIFVVTGFMLKCLTQRPTCWSSEQRQNELCKYRAACCSFSQPFFHSFSVETKIYSGIQMLYLSNISSQIQDPLVLLDPVCLGETLLEWLPVTERILGPAELGSAAVGDSNTDVPGEQRWERDYVNTFSEPSEETACSSREPTDSATEENTEKPSELGENEGQCESPLTADYNEKESEASNGIHPEPVRVVSPKPLPSDLLANLTQLATLYTELSCFRNQADERSLGCTTFLRRYFFLLDPERIRRLCLLCYQEQPEVKSSFTDAMLGQRLLLKSLAHTGLCSGLVFSFFLPNFIFRFYQS